MIPSLVHDIQASHSFVEEEGATAGFFSDCDDDEDDVPDRGLDHSNASKKLVDIELNDDGLQLTVEEDLNQELGCRLWTAGLILCEHIRSAQRTVRNYAEIYFPNLQWKRVLEIGAGLGACGFTAAANGADHVVITECGPQSVARLVQTCEIYRSLVKSNDNVTIRRHLWEEDMEYINAKEEKRSMEIVRHWSKYGQVVDVPTLDFEATFDIVLGSDLLYFSSQEQPLLSVLRLRLRRNKDSAAVLLQTMRTNNACIFERFIEAARLYFDVQIVDVQPQSTCQTVFHETQHTIGYKLVTIRPLRSS
jgi:predicted nicotinamide N-methyase